MSSRKRIRRPITSPKPPPPPAIGPGPLALVFAATTAAAIAERWLFAHAWGESYTLTSAFYYGDAPRFVQYATAILQGRLFDNGIPFHPPGWPLVLAAFMRLSGAVQHGDVVVPIGAVKVFIACLSGLTVGAAAMLAYELSGCGAMLAVSLLGTFQFGHIVEGTVANSEALYGLLFIAALLSAWRWLQPAAVRWWLWSSLAGVAAGCATLVRAEFLAGAVVIALVAWRAQASRTSVAAFLIAFGVVLAPTTVWHWRTLKAFNVGHVGRVAGPLPEFAPVTSYGPFNFAMANHPDADGGPNRDHPMLDQCNQETDERLSAGELDLQCPAVYSLYVHGYTIGAGWLIDHPGDAIALMGRKVEYTIGFLAHGFLIDDVGAGVDGVRRRVDLLDPASQWLVPLNLGLLSAGVWLLWRRPVAMGLLIAPLAALVGSTLLFYGYVRLGAAYLPVIWILEATALAAGFERFVAKRPATSRSIAAALGLLFVLLAFDAVRAMTPRAVTLDGLRTPGGTLVQDETLTVHSAH